MTFPPRAGMREGKEDGVEPRWDERLETAMMRTILDGVGAACGCLAQAYLERDWERIQALCQELRHLWEAAEGRSRRQGRSFHEDSVKSPRAGERTRTSSPTLTPLPCS